MIVVFVITIFNVTTFAQDNNTAKTKQTQNSELQQAAVKLGIKTDGLTNDQLKDKIKQARNNKEKDKSEKKIKQK